MADLASALQHLLKAKRISAPTQSYAKDNPVESQKVFAYLNGGARPTGVASEMGLGLVEVEDVRRGNIPPDPPDPPPVSGPVTITAGGTYRGNWRSTTTGAAVTIATSAPVIIEDSILETTAGGNVLVQSVSGAQVTVRRTLINGIPGGYGRAIRGENFKSWLIENCTINRTGGIYFLNAASAQSIIVQRNKMRNIQGDGGSNRRQFLQLNGLSVTALAEWNEIINVFGEAVSEDVFSVYQSSNATIRNNYVQGGYPATVGGGHQGTGILLGDGGGSNNLAEKNQIVGVTNVLIGIAGGANNRILDNRVVSDGRLPDGTPLAAANNGITCYTSQWGAPTGAVIKGNHIGAMHSGNPPYRNDFWTPAASNNVGAENTFYYDNHSTPITKADEDAEWPRWQAKLASAGITIGA